MNEKNEGLTHSCMICGTKDREIAALKERAEALEAESKAYRELLIDWICGEPAPDCKLQVLGGYAVRALCEHSDKVLHDRAKQALSPATDAEPAKPKRVVRLEEALERTLSTLNRLRDIPGIYNMILETLDGCYLWTTVEDALKEEADADDR